MVDKSAQGLSALPGRNHRRDLHRVSLGRQAPTRAGLRYGRGTDASLRFARGWSGARNAEQEESWTTRTKTDETSGSG